MSAGSSSAELAATEMHGLRCGRGCFTVSVTFDNLGEAADLERAVPDYGRPPDITVKKTRQ